MVIKHLYKLQQPKDIKSKSSQELCIKTKYITTNIEQNVYNIYIYMYVCTYLYMYVLPNQLLRGMELQEKQVQKD